MGFELVPRVVWLTKSQREAVLASAIIALHSPETPPEPDLSALIEHIKNYPKLTKGQNGLITATIKGLKLPPDALPIIVNDSQIEILVEHGNLPTSITYYTKPNPQHYAPYFQLHHATELLSASQNAPQPSPLDGEGTDTPNKRDSRKSRKDNRPHRKTG